MLANEAVKAGYDGIEHINQLLLNFFADHDTDTRTPTRFTLVGDKAKDFDLKSKAAKDFFALLNKHHTVIDPTLVTFEPLYLGRPGKIVPGIVHMVERLPINSQRQALISVLPTEGKEDTYQQSWNKMLATIKALHDAKVTVVTGTDALPGLCEHREIELFQAGGLSAIDAIRAATIVPAKSMKQDKKSGSIAKGKIADLVVIDGDPLAHIEDIERTVTTVKAGVTYSDADLYTAYGVQPLKPR
jgi:hypothetical protein